MNAGRDRTVALRVYETWRSLMSSARACMHPCRNRVIWRHSTFLNLQDSNLNSSIGDSKVVEQIVAWKRKYRKKRYERWANSLLRWGMSRTSCEVPRYGLVPRLRPYLEHVIFTQSLMISLVAYLDMIYGGAFAMFYNCRYSWSLAESLLCTYAYRLVKHPVGHPAVNL